MKKILEVVEDKKLIFRFNTDFDVAKDQDILPEIICGLATAMTTTLWGGNENSVMAMVRALTIADLAVSVNREEMIASLEEASKELAESMADARNMMKSLGIPVVMFPPGVKPSTTGS